MGKSIGLFTRQDLKDGLNRSGAGKTRAGLGQLSAERLWSLGLKGVAGMNPRALHPEMSPSGSKKPLVYVLGEAPGRTEDEEGEPFIGESGERLREQFPRSWDNKFRINNCVRTRPPKNRTPTFTEIECFRPSVQADIEKTKPAVILGVGGIPLQWALGSIKNVGVGLCRGRRFPLRVGSHACWFYPIRHPTEIVAIGEKDGERRAELEWDVFSRDIRQVARDLKKGLDRPRIRKPNNKGVTLITGERGDYERLKKLLEKIGSQPVNAFDWETTHNRPYAAGFKVLSLSVGTKKRTVAFAIDHKEAKWSKYDREQLQKLIRWYFTKTKARKIAHHLAFDLEVLVWMCGPEMARVAKWGCTMQQAYVLDERKNGHNLNFLSLIHHGFQLKEHSDVDRKRLEREPLMKVLGYNAWDSKYTHPIFIKQQRLIRTKRLEGAYKDQLLRVPTLVLTQRRGFPIDQKRVRKMSAEYDHRINRALRKINGRKEVARYKKRFGAFSPSSNDNVKLLFRDVLGKAEGQRGKGKQYSVNEDTLKAIGGPMAKAILLHRKLTKAKSTYIDPLDLRSPDTTVYPDGLIHPQFNSTFVDTGRLSADNPSVQNYPIRDAETRRIRRCFAPWHKDNELVVAIDYGALEFRVIADLSLDKFLIKSCWEDYDVHLHWAKRIIEIYPDTFEERGSDIKAFRSEVKNQFVFPTFYGAGVESRARNVGMPVELMQQLDRELWHQCPGVLAWQKRLMRFYDAHGYVECANGRRRHGPLNKNKIINTGVQGSASDIVVDGMNRMSETSLRLGRPWLHPRLNIHDDLTYTVPERKLESSLEIIIPTMLNTRYSWAKTVPLLVEVKVGKHWGEMKEIGKFRSDQFN